MEMHKKEMLRNYFKAIKIDSLDKDFKSRLVRAIVFFVNGESFDKLQSFYPLCFGDWRNKINVKGI